jgi:uncharacterized protein YbjT (DUF2867 family)
MALKAIIAGSTGMVGKAVLLECIESPLVGSVLLVNRKSIGMTHPKLREVLHGDFFDLAPIAADLKGYDACFYCIGVTSVGLSEAEYHRYTYDLGVHFAQTVQNPGMTFCFVSGAGSDSSEQGRIGWARIKGKTENAIIAMPFKAAYAFRPGFIRPLKGVTSRTPLYSIPLLLLRPILGLMDAFPKYATTSVKLGKALINAAYKGYEKKVLESEDINILAQR